MQNHPLNPSECELEQIQFIESVQPFGSLLAVDHNRVITHAAVVENFGWTADDLIGKNIDMVLQDATRIFDAIKGRTEPTSPLLVRELKARRWLSCIAYQQSELVILELESVPADQTDMASLKFMSERHDSIESYLSYIAQNMRAVTGYDRVMIYKFGLDWHGEVVAESLNPTGHSFYGHHFPASDIPAIARNLFTQLWVRIIPNVEAAAIPLIGKSDEKLDLSKSVLRAPSSVHLQYLRNMDVAASMTMSLICDGKLWGLIACHHFSPKYLIAEQRAVCGLLAKVVSSRITSLAVSATIDATDKLADVSNALCQQLTGKDFIGAIQDSKHSLYEFVKCDGFTFVGEGSVVTEAHVLASDDLSLLVNALNSSNMDMVATDSIQETFPQLESLQRLAAGLLAIKVSNSWFIWNRHEIVRSLLWAGDPNRPLYTTDKSKSLSPGRSFESWTGTVRGTSISWEQYEITAADRLRQMLVAAVEHPTTSKPRADAQAYLRLIRSSINHQATELQNQFKSLNLEGVESE